MRKYSLFTSAFFISALLAGGYGIIHDQITYTISPEYFTSFKYIQFNVNPATFGGDRITVGIIGFLASWWVGGLIGLVIGSISLFFKNNVTAKRVILKSFWIILCTTVVFAFVGFVVGKFYLIKTDVGWWLPEDLQDKNSFILVGTIHNFSYLGGGAGLLVALIYLIIKLIRQFNHH